MTHRMSNRDEIVAQDLLMGSKTAVRNYANALTETTSAEVRDTLKRQLNEAITFHDQMTRYAVNRGMYSPHNVQQQIQHDMTQAQQVTGRGY